MAAKVVIYPGALRKVLVTSKAYGFLLEDVGNQLRAAAITVFEVHNERFNEGRTSEFTPPKYISSFRVRVYKEALKVVMANTDPGWVLVEWGAHPGGGTTSVLRYKPLTRSLIIVGARFAGRQ